MPTDAGQDAGSERPAAAGGLPERIIAAFRERYEGAPTLLVRAPGRVNLIGEHTDYNDGFVLPLALDRAVWIALRPRSDRRVRVWSIDRDEGLELRLDALAPGGPRWGEYLKGVAWALGEAGRTPGGWDGVVGGDVPIGAGLSSSAALTVAAARAFAAVSGTGWEPLAMARAAQRAENGWVGVSCGIMDPLISAVGREGHAVLIDCRTLDTRPVPLPEATEVVVLDTSTRRELADSAYNERRRQCEDAAAALGVSALRDATPEMLEAADGLQDATVRRARHVVTENARTLASADALAAGLASTVGRLMDESHASLRDDFQVSSPELDAIVMAARAAPGCHGARMTGAGFGGCAVALVDAREAARFVEAAATGYRDRTGLELRVYRTRGAAGAAVVRAGGGAWR